jgi:hypothetical protein
MTDRFDCAPKDIVQADPDRSIWGPCLVVVEEVRDWGIVGYTDIPRAGQAPIRLAWDQIKPTGGKAVFCDIDEAHSNAQETSTARQ